MSEVIDTIHYLKDHAYQDIPLNYEEAYRLGEYALQSLREFKSLEKKMLQELKTAKRPELVVAEMQKYYEIQWKTITILSTLHDINLYRWHNNFAKNNHHGHRLPENAAEQIAGICAAVFNEDIKKSEYGFLFLPTKFKIEIMDNCGMGGDIIVTPNISTIAAFIAASKGITMCKHGSPANADKGRHGSSDFLSKICKINVMVEKEKMQECLEKFKFGYIEALDIRYKHIHLQTQEIAKLPHVNDIIGPITNPVHPDLLTKKALGVNHLINPKIVAQTYQILNERGITNLRRGVFYRGFADPEKNYGIDEISICKAGTQVAELKDGIITEYNLYAENFGVEPVNIEDIIPPHNKGEFSMEIFKGNIGGAPLKTILANAAILFYLADKSQDLKECYKMAEEEFESGRPHKLMLEIKEFLDH